MYVHAEPMHVHAQPMDVHAAGSTKAIIAEEEEMLRSLPGISHACHRRHMRSARRKASRPAAGSACRTRAVRESRLPCGSADGLCRPGGSYGQYRIPHVYAPCLCPMFMPYVRGIAYVDYWSRATGPGLAIQLPSLRATCHTMSRDRDTQLCDGAASRVESVPRQVWAQA